MEVEYGFISINLIKKEKSQCVISSKVLSNIPMRAKK